ncbi:Hypothetical predicted protein [Pelobates cultripes]|uniref:C-type lectin domain-containing protein n=1 Tax=Pelobates cultripes TaxID=61616 RepID=A0AAD1VXX5_PELCU|nr:Hypothetical predicted protein [Pelobates cultripes]
MEDFLARSGALADTAETLSISDEHDEHALSVLWSRSTKDLSHTNTPKELYNDLLKLKRRAIDLDLHRVFISDYYRAKRIPRGFRVRNAPTIGRQNPDICKRWMNIANKCSLDWMVIVVEEVGKELIQVKKSIQEFEATNVTSLQAPTTNKMLIKLQDDIHKYQNDLIRFKKQKLSKVNHDYTHHQVYRWLSGMDMNTRNAPPRFRPRISRPSLQTIDISSGESASDAESKDTRHQSRPEPFLGAGIHHQDPPGMSTEASGTEKKRPPRPNLTPDEKAALQDLREDTNIVIRLADKGGGVVIQSYQQYKCEIMRQLNDTSTYRKLTYDPVQSFQKKIQQLIEIGLQAGYVDSNTAKDAVLLQKRIECSGLTPSELLGQQMSSLAAPLPPDKQVGENNSTPGRVTVILKVLLIIMFLFLIALTILVFLFYLNVSEEISVLKKSLFERMQQEIAQNNILSEVQSIKETLDKICKTCPSGWRATGCSCYYFSSSTLQWDKARDECYKFNSALVTFSSKNDMDTFNKLFTVSTRYWMGLRRDATNINMWKWLDGTELTFTNWASGEPNNYGNKEHCGEILSGPWNDRNCDDSVNFICRKVWIS